jgi:long-chain acyl-CoA synthetase
MEDASAATTLLHCFLHWETVRPDAVFLTQPVGDKTIDMSWAEVGQDARRLAAQLLALDSERGGRVALLGKNSAHWVVADIAIMMAGLVSVPIYPTMSADTVRYILDHADIRTVIVGKLGDGGDNWQDIRTVLPPEMPVLALPLAPPIVGIAWKSVLSRKAMDHVLMPEANDICTIIYTSGSTGRPKGVVHSYASMMAIQPVAARRNGGVKPDDRLLSYLPLAHVAERLMVGTAIYNGLRIFFVESLSTFSRDIARARPTLLLTVPRLMMKFKQGIEATITPGQQRWLFAIPIVSKIIKRFILRKLGLDKVRVATSCSAPMPPEVIRWYQKLGFDLLEGYGMSENFGMSHCTEIGRIVPGQVGVPMEGVEARIDETGEILVRSPGQMLGYHREPELTAECMTNDGFFRTGDRGSIDADGALVITGRTKDIFKTSKGKYVAPVPIENAIQLSGIEAVCVLGANRAAPFVLLLPSPDLRTELSDKQRCKAVIDAIGRQLKQLNTTLEPHERLSHAVLVDDEWTSSNGLMTPTLKIVRSAIEAKYGALVEGDWGHTIPI